MHNNTWSELKSTQADSMCFKISIRFLCEIYTIFIGSIFEMQKLRVLRGISHAVFIPWKAILVPNLQNVHTKSTRLTHSFGSGS